MNKFIKYIIPSLFFISDEKRFGNCQLEPGNLKLTRKSDMFTSQFGGMEMPSNGAPIIHNYRRKIDGRSNPKKPKKSYRNALRVDIPCGVNSNAIGLWGVHQNQHSFVPNVYSIDQGLPAPPLPPSSGKRLAVSSTSLSRLPSMESDLNKDSSLWDRIDDDESNDEDENHIYATLSEVNFESHSTLEAQDSDQQDDSSCTTSANEDFEFHNNRFFQNDVTIITIGEQQEQEDVGGGASMTGTRYSSSTSLVPDDESIDADDEESLHELVLNLHDDELNDHYDSGKGDEQIRLQVYRVNKDELGESNRFSSIEPNGMRPSLSMNDLDSITLDQGAADLSSPKDDLFVYPVKSESMLSLFNVFFQETKGPTAAVSDLNISQDKKSDRPKPKYNSFVNINSHSNEESQICPTIDEVKSLGRRSSRNGSGPLEVQANKVTRNGSQKKTYKVSIVECNNSDASDNRSKQVISMRTLLGALRNSDVSYLDTGDVYQHKITNNGTYNRKVTVSDYI